MESQDATGTLAQNAARSVPRTWVIPAVAVALVVVAAALWLTGLGSYLYQRAAYARTTATFSGTSEALKDTVIVPTLDSPCPPNKNVIWCSSFQLAWNAVRDDVIGAPLDVPEAAEVAARLNAAEQSVSDIDPDCVYATGGYIRDGIIGQIEEDMAALFPSHDLPDFSNYGFEPNGIFAYSFIRANVPFKYPFRHMDQGLAFTNSQGIQTRVAGFGLWRAYLRRHKSIREQVEVLYVEFRDRSFEVRECAVDLCRHSRPYQVVVAMVEPRGSLAETLEHLRTQMASFKQPPYGEVDRRLGANDELRVPEMFWRIDHRFKELTDKMVANSNPPMPIVEALQMIEFRLDRSGAVLESEARLIVMSAPRHFEFNRPFLVYVQKRDAEHPFFVMWVDNAELLARQ